ncbi:HNH endonuclease [Streptomyces parvus]|uniref:HNH endonuclease signature motif containing protein n=1 Tax=Streptomyces parvus TaxID=66428 RepID=UPI001239B7B2|nr:HNH endonuclease signature motif containing protein [Streptomyces parvus]KAA6204276.1 HNH endonuclease [Streptomyces parvus]GGS27877.1 hypothetical protein GCM10010221_26930 [Streptomyces parvus]
MQTDAREKDMRRFWSKVMVDASGCLLWTAGQIGNGYGQFYFQGRSVLAHRFAFTVLVGAIPEGLQLDHLCRVRSCVNPNHLEPVTARENVLRGETTPAANLAKAACPAGHVYDATNTRIRANGSRECRTCDAAREQKRREEHNAQRRERWAANREAINARRRGRRAAQRDPR